MTTPLASSDVSADRAFTQAVVVGLGGIGSRHLQGLATVTDLERVVGIDPSPDARAVAAQRWAEVEGDRPPLELVASIEDAAALRGGAWCAIVATQSGPRPRAALEVLELLAPKVLVLEKVLFQRAIDYELVGAHLKAADALVFVNHPRALSTPWQEATARVAAGTVTHAKVRGSGWGLACNALHFLERLLPPSPAPVEIDTAGVVPGSLPAPRPGIRELKGTLVARRDGVEILLVDSDGERGPIEVTLSGRDPMAICEYSDRIEVLEPGVDVPQHHPPILQSRLTGPLVRELRATGCSALPRYGVVAPLHRAMVEAVLAHLVASDECAWGDPCPIT